MKIADLLSPADVMIDVRTSNKGLLLQEFGAKAAASLALQLCSFEMGALSDRLVCSAPV